MSLTETFYRGQGLDALTIYGLVNDAHKMAVEHGFWTSFKDTSKIPEKLMLVVSELSEALEEYRAGGSISDVRLEDGTKKPIGFATEIADAVIRLADLAGEYGIDLEDVIRTKMEFNKTRPFKHGKVC